MAASEEISPEGLIALLAQRDARIAAQDGQITALSTQVADLLEANEALETITWLIRPYAVVKL